MNTSSTNINLQYNYSCIQNNVNKSCVTKQRSNSQMSVRAWMNYHLSSVKSDTCRSFWWQIYWYQLCQVYLLVGLGDLKNKNNKIQHWNTKVIYHMRKRFPELIQSGRMNMRGSTLNSLRDVRKSNNDVLPSF
jgi:hypothetical protein